MDQSMFVVITAFFAVAAIALVIQAAMLCGIRKSSKAMQDEITRLAPRIEMVLNSSAAAVADLKEVTAKTSEVLDITRSAIEYADGTFRQGVAHAREQFEKADKVVGFAVRRFLSPLHTVTGVAKGLGAAIHYLSSRRARDLNSGSPGSQVLARRLTAC